MAVEIFPVVHIHNAKQALEQSSAALEMGADGVFLIDHGNRNPGVLIEAFNHVHEGYPDSFIGLNFLQHSSSAESFDFLLKQLERGDIARLPSGLWVDNAESKKEVTLDLLANNPVLASIQYLGGVAFKYTGLFTSDPGQAAAEATRLEPFVSVVTTSGEGTGKPPSPEKIAAMKCVINKKLAVASGISADNFASYGSTFDQLLVSTSVEVEPYSGIFEPTKLKELINLAHEA
jgi:hypothetical protein